MPSVTRSFSYDPELHPDVDRWLSEVGGYRGALSEAIVRAIRADIKARSGESEDVNLKQILERLDAIGAQIGRLGACSPETPQEDSGDLPEDVANTLANLTDW